MMSTNLEPKEFRAHCLTINVTGEASFAKDQRVARPQPWPKPVHDRAKLLGAAPDDMAFKRTTVRQQLKEIIPLCLHYLKKGMAPAVRRSCRP